MHNASVLAFILHGQHFFAHGEHFMAHGQHFFAHGRADKTGGDVKLGLDRRW